MADSQAVWGIEIGQAGLKAMKLRYAEAAKQAIAVAFDYVPHAKILSQPDAIPEELIPQALETFLSRNSLAGDKVCIAVPGQSALARFIQLPPVESHRVHQIVEYEARQQIPFDLEDVIWDYQNLGGGVEESGFVLEAEVGLFAMKREQVQATLQPFVDRKVEVDVIQIAPLAAYNMLCYDHMGLRPDDGQSAGNEHTIVIDMGADNSTLVVSNGEKIWIRNVPIGGNHFTRALTKEMKLTFAKAEHLKCNATKSPDPRAVFQALRPVFNDYVSEIQRSIGYFSSVNRDAVVKEVLGVGNGFKLAGLQKFLQQNLQYEVERVDNFKALVGDNVLGDPVFQDNVLSFAVPYGLALQGLGVTTIHTSLLPPEITRARLIRRKKPWALVTAASLLVGFAGSVAMSAGALAAVDNENWESAKKAADSVASSVTADQTAYDAERTRNTELDARITGLLAAREKQQQWLELYKAIYDALPHEIGDDQDIEKLPERMRMKVTSVQVEPIDDLAPWWTVRAASETAQALGKNTVDVAHPPTGPGYVVRVIGQHYHHNEENPQENGVQFVLNTYLRNLQQWDVANTTDNLGRTPIRDQGISHAIVLETNPEVPVRIAKDEDRIAALKGGGAGAGTGTESEFGLSGTGRSSDMYPTDPAQQELEKELYLHLRQTSFVIEFAWVPRSRSDREKFSAVRQLLQGNAEITLEDVNKAAAAHVGLVTDEEFTKFKTWYDAAQPPTEETPSS